MESPDVSRHCRDVRFPARHRCDFPHLNSWPSTLPQRHLGQANLSSTLADGFREYTSNGPNPA